MPQTPQHRHQRRQAKVIAATADRTSSAVLNTLILSVFLTLLCTAGWMQLT